MFSKSAIFVLVLTLAVSACQSAPTESTPIAAGSFKKTPHISHVTGPGILLQAWAGNDIVSELDARDNEKDQQAEIRAETGPIGQKITWNNPDTGHSGTILPVHDGYDNNGIYCRDFQQSIAINGQQRQGSDKACQQPDGSWKIVL